MPASFIFTSESVSEGHPDKVCDYIADSVLDAHLAQDPASRVACEVLCKDHHVVLAGEISSRAVVDVEAVARAAIREIGYTDPAARFNADEVHVQNFLGTQSPHIAQGVIREGETGAGDQGLVFGFATRETPELMPLPISLAHAVMRALAAARHRGSAPWLRPDAKAQVSVRYDDGIPVAVTDVVVSTQHAPGTPQDEIRAYVTTQLLPSSLGDWWHDGIRTFVNPTGEFSIGGPEGDCGVTGRKIIVDTYGGYARHGGGAFSGKDATKVDRSAGLLRALRGAADRAARDRRHRRDPGGLRHRRGAARLDSRRHAGHRRRTARRAVRAPVRLPARRDHRVPRSARARLPHDDQLRALRQARPGVGTMSARFLRQLGVFGYDDVEPVILAALVTEDPLLLIGRAGTGKTFLLNSLSEALGLEHRHYNASLIAFDDLVGFPWPEADGSGIRYIETPATVWKAESVLVDEINRCKPEHQNRLFSLVHERRVQGMKLERLRFRWAAMNPAGFDQEARLRRLRAARRSARGPLRVSRAGRRLGRPRRRRPPRDRRSDVGMASCRAMRAGSARSSPRRAPPSNGRSPAPNPLVIGYSCHVATTLGDAGLRISPRRVRQLVRNILAVESVSRLPRERNLRLTLEWSLPQRSGLTSPDAAVILAAHRRAWEAVCSVGEERWLHRFHSEQDLARKINLLLETCPCPDTGTLAVSQFLASESFERQAIVAFALYPALLVHAKPPVGDEGIQDLGRIAVPMLELDAEVSWRDRQRQPYLPGRRREVDWRASRLRAALGVLQALKGERKKRAEQVFLHLLAQRALTKAPQECEALLNRCFAVCRKFHGTASR